MKKLTKICIIIAAVFGVLGIFLVIGSIAGGATWATLKTAVPFLEDREFDLLEEIEDKGGDARYREEAGAYSEKEYEDIREIQVELSDDRIEFLIYDGPDVRVEVQDDVQSRVAHYLDGSHELVIESHGKGNPYSTVLVYLPENLSLKELDIQVGGGVVEMEENIQGDEIQVEIGAGAYQGETVRAEKSKWTVGAGTIQLENLDCPDIELECGVGKIEASVKGSQTDYNYKLSNAAGEILLGEGQYSGVGVDEKIKNENASGKMEISCGLGNVTIGFIQ